MARADGSGCAAAGSGQLRGARRFVARRRGAILRAQARGGMAEWLKAHAWKACIRETVSWVRIPLPPPANLFATVRFRPPTAADVQRFARRLGVCCGLLMRQCSRLNR